MSWIAVVLLSISAVAHAYWNLRGKAHQPSAAMFLIGDATVAMLLLPILFFTLPVIMRMPGRFWIFVVATGFCEAMYYAGLAGGVSSGKSVGGLSSGASEPPVVLVAAISLMLGRVGHIATLSLVGMGIIVGGCAALPWNGRRPALRGLRSGLVWAMLAAIGSSGYMLIDDRALALLRSVPGAAPASAAAALRYAPLVALSTTAWLGIFVALRAPERTALNVIRRSGLAYAQKTGLAIWLAYGLVMISMGYARDVSYVTAFRQISIPIGAIFGVTILREAMPWYKMFAVLMVFAGVVIVALN